ncbi:MAG: O-antigen ligase family protein [Oscillospiraceae bacterium]
MNQETPTHTASGAFQRHLPTFVFIFFLLQPIMDMLSYWTDRLGMGNTLTLALRFAVLAIVAVAGFCVSQRKKAYGWFVAACGFLLIGHILACCIKGYLNPIHDLTNFVRVAQMPLFVLCLISFLRANDRCYRAIENGLIANFWIISISVLIGVLTGTAGATYQNSKIGILGWFATTNSQSAIMSILVPIVLLLYYRKKNFWLFLLTTAVAFVQLYFIGTRLAFFAIVVTVVGIVIVTFLTHDVSKRYLAVLVIGMALCCAFIKVSPMYQNQNQYNVEMSSKQGDAEVMMKNAESASSSGGEEQTFSAAERYRVLSVIYRFYSPDLCERFGTARVMSAYDYTSLVSDITATRRHKIVFCEMLMDEHPWISRLFGMELSRMQFDGEIYDVENDFHGIYFLYGWVGLAMMLTFLGYFIFLIVRALLQNFRKYFTTEAGAFGMAFCLALINAYCTAGVLRRPNASFYLSVLLAVIYYLTQLRDAPNAASEKEALCE